MVWRCHVGLDHPNGLARRAWEFLRPYVEEADAYVFSRRAFAWEGLDEARLWLVAPSIDAFSAKNQELELEAVRAILARTGLADDEAGAPVFLREDGTAGTRRSRRRARPGGHDPAGRSPRRTGLALGPAQGSRRRASLLRRARQAPGGAPAARRPVGRRGRGRPRGRRGPGGGPGSAGATECRAQSARPPRLSADGRRRGERRDRQRGPAPRRRRSPEEPRGGVRADRRRGDVEGAPGRRQPHRRDPGPDRRRRVGGC